MAFFGLVVTSSFLQEQPREAHDPDFSCLIKSLLTVMVSWTTRVSDDLGGLEEMVQVAYETFPCCDLLGGFLVTGGPFLWHHTMMYHLLTSLGLDLSAAGVIAKPRLSKGSHFPLGSLCSSEEVTVRNEDFHFIFLRIEYLHYLFRIFLCRRFVSFSFTYLQIQYLFQCGLMEIWNISYTFEYQPIALYLTCYSKIILSLATENLFSWLTFSFDTS